MKKQIALRNLKKGGEKMVAINKIRGRLTERGFTQSDLAKAWNCATPTVSQKLSGKRPITLEEAETLGKLLELTEQEYYELFFAF